MPHVNAPQSTLAHLVRPASIYKQGRRSLVALALFATPLIGLGACDPGNLPSSPGPSLAPAPLESGSARQSATDPSDPSDPSDPADPADPADQGITAQMATSRVTFVVTKATGEHTGHFSKFDARARYNEDEPDKLETLRLTIDIASLEADDAMFAQHVKSPTFLNVAKYPSATFVSDELMQGGRKMKGRITLRGVEVPVVVKTRLSTGDDRQIAEADFSLSLSRFGITDPLIDAEMVDDVVELELHLEFPSPAP